MCHFNSYIIASALLLMSGGCLDLQHDLVVSDVLPRANVTAKEDDTRSVGTSEPTTQPSVKMIDSSARGKAGATSEAPGVYAGLELLNRQAGNPSDVPSTTRDVKSLHFESERRLGTSARVVRINYIDGDSPLDPQLAQDPSVKRFLEASRQTLSRTGERQGKLNAVDAAGMARKLARSISHIQSDEERRARMAQSLDGIRDAKATSTSNEEVTIPVALDAIAIAYMQAYIEGNFVARNGTTISQPEISMKIGNDTITAFETVLLEAVFDYATMTPVIDEGKDSAEKKTPTFVVLFPALYEKISADSAKQGITETELSLIAFLSGIGAEQSKHLSALIMRAFGGADISFIIGAKFSFGDNETLSKVVSIFCEAFVRCVVDTLNYDFFEQFRYSVSETDGKKEFYISDADAKANRAALKIDEKASLAVAKLLQYQDVLIDLLKKKT
jgi:hypothetical protein